MFFSGLFLKAENAQARQCMLQAGSPGLPQGWPRSPEHAQACPGMLQAGSPGFPQDDLRLGLRLVVQVFLKIISCRQEYPRMPRHAVGWHSRGSSGLPLVAKNARAFLDSGC